MSEVLGRAYPLAGIPENLRSAGLLDEILRSRVCHHTGNEARMRELEVKLRNAQASNDALDSTVRTAHAHIERLEKFIRSKGLEREARLR